MGLRIMLGLIPLIFGCGQAPHDPGIFSPYVQEFEDTARSQGVSVSAAGMSIEFGTPAISDELANCDWSGHIVVKQDVWDGLNEYDRKMLMFHEMGHCVLGRQHSDQPGSIMSAAITSKFGQEWMFPKISWELFHPGDFSHH